MSERKEKEVLVYVDPRLEKLIPKFMTAQKTQFELMKAALKNLKYEDLKLLGHRMKGSCGGYGFALLGELGGKVEKAAEVQDFELLSDSISKLEICFESLKIEYRKI